MSDFPLIKRFISEKDEFNMISEEEFSKKYNLYSQLLFNISYGYTHNIEDAEDILQEVFMKYLKLTPTFASEQEEKYWLIRVTINASISLTRKSYRKKVSLDDGILYNTSVSQNEDYLIDLVMTLPEKYKKVIILYYYDELSVKEIAKILRITEAAVMKRMERGRKILRNLVEEN